MLSRSEQRRIVRADNERRLERDIAEHLLLNHPSQATPTETGVPNNHNRVCRASRNSWDRGMRGKVVGIAPGTESTSDGTPTVLVTHADGTQEVRTVSSFRKTATRATAQTTSRASQRLDQSDLAKYADTIGYATELNNE